MTINVISDIHVEHDNSYKSSGVKYANGFDPSKLNPADILIIAGDLALDDSYKLVLKDIINKTKNKFKKVLFIRGNHDYWQYPVIFSNKIRLNSYRSLEYVDEENKVAIIGRTLWSPISHLHKFDILRMVVDYHAIPNLTVSQVNHLYELDSAWIRNKYNKYKDLGYKVVIVTHHVPNENLIDDKFKGSSINSAFTVMDGSLNDIKPTVWIHGHTHTYMDKVIDGTRYIRNPIGYVGELKDTHWYNTIVEV